MNEALLGVPLALVCIGMVFYYNLKHKWVYISLQIIYCLSQLALMMDQTLLEEDSNFFVGISFVLLSLIPIFSIITIELMHQKNKRYEKKVQRLVSAEDQKRYTQYLKAVEHNTKAIDEGNQRELFRTNNFLELLYEKSVRKKTCIQYLLHSIHADRTSPINVVIWGCVYAIKSNIQANEATKKLKNISKDPKAVPYIENVKTLYPEYFI